MNTKDRSLPLAFANNWGLLPGDFAIIAAHKSKTTTAFLRRMAEISLNYDQSTLLISRHSADQEEKRIHDLLAIKRGPEYPSTEVSLRVRDYGSLSTIDTLLAALAEDVAEHSTRLVLIDSPELILSNDPRLAQQEVRRLKVFGLTHSVAIITTAKTVKTAYEAPETRASLVNPELRREADLEFLLASRDFIEGIDTIQLHCIESCRAKPKSEFFRLVDQTGELDWIPSAPPSLTDPADSLCGLDFEYVEETAKGDEGHQEQGLNIDGPFPDIPIPNPWVN